MAVCTLTFSDNPEEDSYKFQWNLDNDGVSLSLNDDGFDDLTSAQQAATICITTFLKEIGGLAQAEQEGAFEFEEVTD